MADYLSATAPAAPAGPQIKYKLLKKRHPEYDLQYWKELRALYEGGKALLRNPEVLDAIFPRHGNESEEAWGQRKKRAFYVNHLGTVIDKIVAELSCDEIKMIPPGQDPDDEVTLDKFWGKYMNDCSPPGGQRQSFAELMLEQARTGLLLGRMWTLDELPPPPPEDMQPDSLAEQKEGGYLDGYTCQVPPECVLDWEEGRDGRLVWVRTCFVSRHHADPFSDEVLVREDYTIYDEIGWFRFVVEYDEDQGRVPTENRPLKKKPNDDDAILGTSGSHSFQRVPLVRLTMPPGLWAGNKLHSLAVEYLNKSCGLSWAEANIFFAQLYEFLGSEMGGVDTVIPSEAQQDPHRARRQPRGPDIVQVRGQDDSADYISPPADGLERGSESLQSLEEQMYRITYQMALGENNSGALIRRSADSKELDHAVTQVITEAVGDRVKYHAIEVVDTAAVGRGDRKPTEPGWTAKGMEGTQEVDADTEIGRAVSLEVVQLPSATFQQLRKQKLAKAVLGDAATTKVMDDITKELKVAITQDNLIMMAAPPPPPGEDDDAGGGFHAKRGAGATPPGKAGSAPPAKKKGKGPAGK